MKQKWKRRCRGAISIFLIIIFLAQYILCGLLVDSARHRMASAMAESALDSASRSVLSYYNQLVYDLYGLMATDSMSEEKIKEKLTSYVERTLGTAELEGTSALKRITDLAETALFPGEGFDGYDFQVTVDAKTTTSLANTQFVEYQLIEHMKYRAPVLLLDGTTGFLSKLGDLADVAERLGMAKEKIDMVNGRKDQEKAASTTLSDIDAFIQQVGGYVKNPDTWTTSTKASPPVTPKDVNTYLKPIDDAVEKAAEDYLEEWKDYRDDYEDYEEACENAGPDDPAPTPPTAPSWSQSDWEAKLKPGVTKAKDNFENARKNGARLHTLANGMLGKINSAADDYTVYAGELEKKLDGSENAKTVWGPEIHMAKSNAGQLLKNRPFVSYVKEFTKDFNSMENITRVNLAMDGIVSDMARDLAKSMEAVEGTDGDDSLPTSLCDSAAEMLEGTDFSWMSSNLLCLKEILEKDAIPGVSKAEVDVKVDGKKAKKEAEEKEVETAGLRNLKDHEDDLKVEYTAASGDDTLEDFETGDEISNEDGAKMLAAAGGILDKLMGLLEELRDGVYVNQYAAYYFPNYVENYKATDKLEKGDNAKKFNDGSYKNFCATQAELEYILTGEADTKKSVVEVQAMLLGIRTAFNMIAIFTDSAKVSQANSISVVAGPFAPAVAIALLIAWALAESVLDVMALCDGEKVPLFKQGADWTLSVEGAVKKAVDKVVGDGVTAVVNAATEKINSMVDQVESAANEAIYAAYNGGVEKAKETMDQWKNQLDENLTGVEGGVPLSGAINGAVGEFKSTLNQSIDYGSEKLNNALSDMKDKAIQQTNKAAEKIKESAKTELTKLGENFSDKAAEAVGGWISNKLPVGTPTDTGSGKSFLGMSYMDYMQLFLLISNQEKKIQRIQSLIQANIRYGGRNGEGDSLKTFSMGESYGAVEATLDGSIKFLFMSEPIIPASMRQDGRLKLSAHSAVSY